MRNNALRPATRKTAKCVSGILIKRGRVLVEKRRDNDESDPGLVFLPGGHVEPGESLEDALTREMKEELGILVEKTIPIGIRYHVTTDGERQRVHYFHVKAWSGKIRSLEAARTYWESKVDNLSEKAEQKIVRRILKGADDRE